MADDEVLREREKELACIYSICLLAAEAPHPKPAAEGIAAALCAAMSHANMARCLVRLERIEDRESLEIEQGAIGGKGAKDLPFLESALPDEASIGWRGSVRIEYLEPHLRFLDQEKALLDSVVVVTASLLRRADLIARLRATSKNLAAKNVALREVLSLIEDERRRMQLAFLKRLTADILPLAERARDPALAPDRRSAYLDLLVEELQREGSSMGIGAAENPALSPREREIAVQVRNGRTSKEIAELLGIAEATVERHRHNIRKKLKIANRGINLTTLLGNKP
jgi:DNA-binding CsgD family transcriptional regulator